MNRLRGFVSSIACDFEELRPALKYLLEDVDYNAYEVIGG